MVYEIVGSKEKAVAVIGYGTKNPRKVAKQIMKGHKHVKSVLVKTGQRAGIYRTHPAKLLLGDKNTEVRHKEHGYIIKVDPRKAYFSPRESTERQRIANMVKKREKILIMFSGVAPYALAIKKKQPDCHITCVEINPYAVKYADDNVRLNKIRGIKNIRADVRKLKLGKFDRILMPLPETASEYLDIAFHLAKKRAVIHLYGFAKSSAELAEKVSKGKIIKKQKVLPYGPGIYKYRVDIRVS